MMQWEKRGLIRPADVIWADHSFLQPTPLLLGNVIRTYGGLRDKNGISRIGYLDLDAHNPSNVLGMSKTPVLDIGQPGFFDDNGVVPCAVIQREEGIYLYYAGYQLAHKVRFVAYTGLAISKDGGQTFTKTKTVPALERAPGEELFRAVHSILKVDGVWKVYYGAGNAYIQGKEKTLPLYNIRYMESGDGVHFSSEAGRVILNFEGDQYRIGRPYVVKTAEKYHMFFGYSTPDILYKLGYASSIDGLNWVRDDAELNLDLSADGFDSQMMAYPSLILHPSKTYLFYNGNDYGKEGFGYAELTGGKI